MNLRRARENGAQFFNFFKFSLEKWSKLRKEYRELQILSDAPKRMVNNGPKSNNMAPASEGAVYSPALFKTRLKMQKLDCARVLRKHLAKETSPRRHYGRRNGGFELSFCLRTTHQSRGMGGLLESRP